MNYLNLKKILKVNKIGCNNQIIYAKFTYMFMIVIFFMPDYEICTYGF